MELTQEKLNSIEATGVNRPSASVAPEKSQVVSEHPRVLLGDERTKFVTTLTSYFPDHETVKIAKKVQEKTLHQMAKQYDRDHLEKQCLPPVPKGLGGPIIATE